MTNLGDEVEKYVKTRLANYQPLPIRAPKVIHDTVWGSNLFMPYEIALLDLPLVQRLRRISQVAVAALVYPSSNHNRFEHSLGVAVIAEQLVNALFQKLGERERKGRKQYVDLNMKDYVMKHVRIAALMHDCGHGPFSHLSEAVYKRFTDIREIKKQNEILSNASAHEILSYLIVTSDSFKVYFQKHIAREYDIDVDLNMVGQMIVGYVDKPELAFIVDIINGAFDADKLDYIQRDSHFTGIKMVLDLHRLFHTIDLVYDKQARLRLSVDISGVSTLEQIVFNKMMLFNTVYHHHKVRAAENVFRDLVLMIKEKGIPVRGVRFNSAADFLYLTDDDIYTLTSHEDPKIKNLAINLTNRRLPKRALVLSRKTTAQDPADLLGLVKACERDMISLRKAISKVTATNGEPVSADEVWIDLRDGPSFEEAVLCPIKSIGEKGDYIELREVLPVGDWVKAFSQVKWTGYVFSYPNDRKAVYNATKELLRNVFNIELNEFAWKLCKVEDVDTAIDSKQPQN